METETGRLDPRPLLLKRMIWDVHPHDNDIIRGAQARLGLVPDSDDGLDSGHSASDTRINRTAPLGESLEVLSECAAEVVGDFMLMRTEAELPGVKIPDGFRESLSMQNAQVIYEASYAIIAHFLDRGVLEYGKKVRG